MAVTYKWIINNIVVADDGDHKDIIKEIIWAYEGLDSETNMTYRAPRSGPINFGVHDPDNFKSFNDFTKEEIEQWLEANVPNVEELKSSIQQIIESRKKLFKKTKPAPWL